MTKHFLIVLSCLSLAGCGTITRGLSDLEKGESYKAAKTYIKSLRFDPPHIALNNYKSPQERPKQRRDLAVALAASGGGYRASNLTAGVMLGLEKIHNPLINSNLLEEVDYFSSVSGGGFVVGLYLSHRVRYSLQHPGQPYPFNKAFFTGKSPLKKRLQLDYSDDLFFGHRRSWALEDKLSKNLLQVSAGKELTLGDIYLPKNSKKAVLHPLWITNSTILQNSNLFQFVPDVLKKYKISGYFHRFASHPVRSKKDAVYGSTIPFAIGMTASAAFPYAIEGTTLESHACRTADCYLQLFDGGLVDNLGVYSALEVLRQEKTRYKLLIIVDAFSESPEPFSVSHLPPKKLDLLHRVMASGPNSFQRQMRDFIPLVAKNLLCTPGTEQVLVAYLDLYHAPKAREVKTALWISKEEQDLMIQTGLRLVKENKILNSALPRMLQGIQVAPCHGRAY